MPLVTFEDENLVIEVSEGSKLIDCIRKAELKLETPCNGIGKCGKCKVKAFGHLYPKNNDELMHTEEENIRLACTARVRGDVTIQFIGEKGSLKTINEGFSYVSIEVDNSIERVELPPINEQTSTPYKETLGFMIDSINLLKKIGIIERNNLKKIIGVTYKNILLDIRENIEKLLGIAIDIGTTGISAYLIDLESGEILSKISDLNPQTEFGGDVLSRISFAMNESNGIEILSKCIRQKINHMVKELVSNVYSLDDIYRVAISANTTMLHMFLGINPESIANAPYRSIFLNEVNLKSTEIGLGINEEGIITLLPSVSSYVGADITSGIVVVDFHNKKYPAIFIDIGTNGEIVVIKDGKMSASSTAAGPALEGMNISCGMRAENGAIDKFKMDKYHNISYSTIGDVIPKGICGSGLIDIISYLVKYGVISPSGKFSSQLPERLKSRLVDRKFYITEEVYLSQKDIREIQLAKGAISAGINMLLDDIGTNINKIEEIVIAGAFGYHIDIESMKTVGLIPKGFNGKVSFVGNSSVEGARIALINENKLKEMSNIRNDIRVVELSMRTDFQDNFIGCLNF